MNFKTFLTLILAIFIGALVALAVAALYAKDELAAATAGNPLLTDLSDL